MRQVIVKGVTKTFCFHFEHDLSVQSLKQFIEDRDGIPYNEQLLVHQGKNIQQNLEASESILFVEVLLKNVGGKGGFGSLLRGGQSGVVQAKTTNFNACRDLSGRRIRHVKQEQDLVKWKQAQIEKKKQEEQEKTKTKALPFFDQAKFNEEASSISDMVTNAIKDAFSSDTSCSVSLKKRKRKQEKFTPYKKIKGLDDEDHEPEKEEASEEEEEEEKKLEEEEDPSIQESTNATEISVDEKDLKKFEEEQKRQEGEKKSKKINLENYSTVSELEDLGLEVLKDELQKRGLKFGGSLRQRAERLFSIRGKPKSEWPASILAKPPKKQK